MTIRMLLLLIASFTLLGALTPAVFFRVQHRVQGLVPVKGRWVGPFLWGTASLSFVIILTLAYS